MDPEQTSTSTSKATSKKATGKTPPQSGRRMREVRKEDALKTKTIVRQLPCKLSREEIEQRSGAMVSASRDLNEIEKEKKLVNDDFTRKIKAQNSTIQGFVRVLYDKTEMRPVDCEVQHDYGKGTVATIRMDDNTIVDTRAMTTEERQFDMFEDVTGKEDS